MRCADATEPAAVWRRKILGKRGLIFISWVDLTKGHMGLWRKKYRLEKEVKP